MKSIYILYDPHTKERIELGEDDFNKIKSAGTIDPKYLVKKILRIFGKI